MDVAAIVAFLQGILVQYPQLAIIGVVLALLGTLVVLAQALIFITPGKSDDEQLAKIEAMPIVGTALKVLVAFAPIRKQ